jgi:hypothetical protein
MHARERRVNLVQKCSRVRKYLDSAGSLDGFDEAELVEDVGAAHDRDHHLNAVRAEHRLHELPPVFPADAALKPSRSRIL